MAKYIVLSYLLGVKEQVLVVADVMLSGTECRPISLKTNGWKWESRLSQENKLVISSAFLIDGGNLNDIIDLYYTIITE